MLRFLISAVISAAVSILVCTCAKSRGSRPVGARIIEEAAKAGRTARAKRISKVWQHLDEPNDQHAVKYEYFVDGRRYVKTCWSVRSNDIHDEITVFWREGRPWKAYVSQYDKLGMKHGILYIVPMAVFVMAYVLLPFFIQP